MNSLLLLQAIFSFLPFEVCLLWTACFAVQCRKGGGAKGFFLAYIATCTVLYFCHGLFFTLGLPYEVECLWTLCSLSVYPLFFGYLCRLTSRDYSVRQLLPWLVPGVIVAMAKYALPDAGIDRVRMFLFAVQIVCVVIFGVRRLKAFDRRLQDVYADTEGRDTTAVHHLLIAVIVVSLLAAVANSAGRQYFGETLGLLIAISVAFSVMLSALSYICFCRDFSIDELCVDEEKDGEGSETAAENDIEDVGLQIEALMTEQRYYLRHDLKIGDVVKAVGSNRTYVSNYINSRHGCSFNDYINSLRVEYAKELLASASEGIKLTQVAEDSGFSSDQSFYRNFKKFVGVTPSDWQHHAHLTSAKESPKNTD